MLTHGRIDPEIAPGSGEDRLTGPSAFGRDPLVRPDEPLVPVPESDPVRQYAEDRVKEPALPLEFVPLHGERRGRLQELLFPRPEVCRRCLGAGTSRLKDGDVLPNRERADDSVSLTERGGRGEDVHGSAVRRRHRERDVDRHPARERPADREIGRRKRRTVRVAEVEDANRVGEGAAGEPPAGEGLGLLVRLCNPTVGAVEERGLPDGGECERKGGHDAFPAEALVILFSSADENVCHAARDGARIGPAGKRVSQATGRVNKKVEPSPGLPHRLPGGTRP